MNRIPRRAFPAFILFVVAGLLAGCVHPAARQGFSPTPSESRLADAMARRLEVSRRVAWVKFLDNRPVRDDRREAEILAEVVRLGEGSGLSARTVGKFFAAQMRASRKEQERLIASWKRGGTLPAYPPQDLKTHIRPELDGINRQMLEALRVPPRPGTGRFVYGVLREWGFSPFVAGAAVAPLP
jgi:chorismate mutase